MSIRMFTVLGKMQSASNKLNLNRRKNMDDEIDPNKVAETAIGVFIGLLAFKVVKIIIRELCA